MSVERAGQLLRELSGSPAFMRMNLPTAFAVVLQAAAPELIARDGTVDAQDLRRIVTTALGG
jgi:hypothetical protein